MPFSLRNRKDHDAALHRSTGRALRPQRSYRGLTAVLVTASAVVSLTMSMSGSALAQTTATFVPLPSDQTLTTKPGVPGPPEVAVKSATLAEVEARWKSPISQAWRT